MKTISDIHEQFAHFFKDEALQPYAYLVSKKLNEGHICIEMPLGAEELAELAPDLPSVQPNDSVLRESGLVCTYEAAVYQPSKQPFVWHNNRLYLQRYFAYETLILKRVAGFLTTETAAYSQRSQQLIEQKAFIRSLFKPQAGATLAHADWQLAAAISGVLNNFTIITGGPGTGKTTTVAKLLAILYSLYPGLKVALAAPTGKASARIAESIKNARLDIDEKIVAKFKELEPSTIHRLLKPVTGSPYFKHDQGNPLRFDVVIVDESSMMDAALFAKLLDAIGPGTRLILLGDKDQLASVEAGSLFGDLCNAQEQLNHFSPERLQLMNSLIDEPGRKIPDSFSDSNNPHPLFQHVIELRHSHRFSDQEGIGRISRAVINNNVSILESFLTPGADDKVTIDPLYDDELFQQFIMGYAAYINEPDIAVALKKMNDLKVLCAVREGPQGLHAVNKKIEDLLIRQRIIRRTGEFYDSRPIMVTANNYDLGLFNGDIGIIRRTPQGVPMAWFEDSEGGLKQILPGYISEMETVFAMTIHKSQGSEFREVLIVLPQREINILTRELLYTGITRTREKVIIQGSAELIMKAAEAHVKRTSGIKERFTATAAGL